jgi:methylenetetrahydrofolate dehydrogenase (NADP+)/methenyltetrahydrofolate cyclohydrolase
MSAVIIDGAEVAKRIRGELAEKIARIEKEDGVRLGLATIIVGGDPASIAYVRNKDKVCREVGLNSFTYELPKQISEESLLDLIDELNERGDVHGILVQIPLPEHIDEDRVARQIVPFKDVDCFHPKNLGKLYRGEKCILPCTPKGIIRLIKEDCIVLTGKKVAVIGRSNIVGKPVSLILLNNNATVTMCHSKTVNLKNELLNSDIIVSAVGKPGMVTGDMVREGAVVIDVGTTYVDGKMKGDVDFESVKEKASFITPVPGGVGSMTTAMLIENVLEAAGYE